MASPFPLQIYPHLAQTYINRTPRPWLMKGLISTRLFHQKITIWKSRFRNRARNHEQKQDCHLHPIHKLPVDGMNAEPVDLVANTSTVSLDLGNREQAGSVSALEGSTFHRDILSPDWLRRNGINSALSTPDWSSGFNFSTN